MKLVVIVGAVLVLLVAFGRNPVEEGRDRRAKAMEGKNPLVHAIQEHNSDSNKMGFSRNGKNMSYGNNRGTRGTGAKNLPSGAIKVGSNKRSRRTQNRSTMYGTPPSVTNPAPSGSIQQSGGGYYPPPAPPEKKSRR
ncbi:MAG: hypothetical protein ACN2B6_02530 [Rickettsiales bacterium]